LSPLEKYKVERTKVIFENREFSESEDDDESSDRVSVVSDDM
jgi:hypothetical protein